MENLKNLAESAAQKALTLQAERVRTEDARVKARELQQMVLAEAETVRQRQREQCLEEVEDVLWEVLDRAWSVVRKRSLSQQRMNRVGGGHSPRKELPKETENSLEKGLLNSKIRPTSQLSEAARRQLAEKETEVHNEEFLAQQFVQKKSVNR